MTEFNPAGFYELDVARGTVRTKHGDRVVVMTDNAAGALVSSALEAAPELLRLLGAKLGAEAARTLKDVNGSSPQAVLNEAAAALGVFGWGKLGIQHWGDALVLTLDDPPAGTRTEALAALLGGFFSAVTGRELACVGPEPNRFLVIDPTILPAVAGWVGKGEGLATIVGKLGRA